MSPHLNNTQLTRSYQSSTGDNSTPGATIEDDSIGSKELPLLMQRRPGIPRLTVLWDLESLKPFTQQYRSDSSAGDTDTKQQQPRARDKATGSRFSRLAAAGLSGVASAPDLIGALDQLCRTLKQYGTVHAVHLFLRESTVSKAPTLRRQVQQLCTWVTAPCNGEEQGPPDGTGVRLNMSEATSRVASLPNEPAANSSSSGMGNNRGGHGKMAGLKGAGANKWTSTALAPGSDVHDCPMCRSAFSSRLDLLRHFSRVHQGPLLVATSTNARTHIMWTRGRAVGLSAEGSLPGGDDATDEKVLVSPEVRGWSFPGRI